MNLLLVSEAAKELGMNTQTLRLALQQNLFPFGKAIKTSENRYTYYINDRLLELYKKGCVYEEIFNIWNTNDNDINRLCN